MNKAINVLICVTRQKACERLIRMGKKMAAKGSGQPYVLHIAKTGENFLGSPHEGEALDYLFQVSKYYGAEMTVMRSEHIVDSLIEYARKHDIGTVVLGESPQSEDESNIISQLKKKLKHVEYVIVPA